MTTIREIEGLKRIMVNIVKSMPMKQFEIFAKLNKNFVEIDIQEKKVLLDLLSIVKDEPGCENKEKYIYLELQKTVDHEGVS